jgi:DNA-binding transcriptional MerR regulator
VPIATIKFYLREGILPRGERTAPNQARYGDAHLKRLALIGTLQRVGLSLAVIKQALRAMDATSGDSPEYMAIAVGSLEPYRREGGDARPDPTIEAEASALLRAMVEHRGWQVDETVPIWQEVVRAVAAILTAWPAGLTNDGLERYAAVAEELAAFELPETWNPTASPADALTYVVLGTVLFEPLILALRRLAHVDRGAKLRTRRTRPTAPAPDVGTPPTG